MQDKIHFDLGLITKNKLFPDHKTKEREKEMVTELTLLHIAINCHKIFLQS